MASSETLVDGADAAVVSKVKEIFIEHQRQTMGTRYMKEMKERRERRMESRNESMHEFIDQLTTDADGNYMTGLQRLDLHQRAVEMNGADRTDPAMLAMLLCREDTGTTKDIAAAAINRAVVGAMDGVWRMITDQPRSGESRKERENRKKRRSKRKRKRNHIVRLEQTAEGDTRMRTIPRRRNGIRPTLAHWIAEQMACPTTSNKSSGHFEQHEESSREHDQTPAPEGGTSEEGESNEDTQVIQSTTGTGEGAQPQTGKHEQDHMCAGQCNSGQTEGKSATRQYLDDLMVSWRTCSEGTSGKAIDLDTVLPKVSLSEGWKQEIANDRHGDRQEADRWWRAMAQKMGTVFQETHRLRAHLVEQELQIIFGSWAQTQANWQWRHTRFSKWYNKAMKEYTYTNTKHQSQKVKKGVTNWGMTAWRWLVRGEAPGTTGASLPIR